MTGKAGWRLGDGVGWEVPVDSVEELRTKVCEARRGRPNHAILWFGYSPEDYMYVGVVGDTGFLRYGGDGPGHVSVGDPDAGGSLWFSYAGTTSEIARRNCLPMAVLLNALAEYFESGRLPSAAQWEPD